MVLPVAVTSKGKSRAQGRDRAPSAGLSAPSSRRGVAASASLRVPGGLLRATAAGSSCDPPRQPSRTATVWARRYPQRGCCLAKSRSQERSSRSGSGSAGVWRWVEWCCPTIRHARPSAQPQPILQHPDGSASLRRAHQLCPRDLPGGVDLELLLCHDLLQAPPLPFQLLQPLCIVGLQAAVLVPPPQITSPPTPPDAGPPPPDQHPRPTADPLPAASGRSAPAYAVVVFPSR